MALIVIALAAGLVAAEVALRVIVPSPRVYQMLIPGTRVFEPDPRFVHGISGPARYVVNRHGIRSRDFGPDGTEYRILLVGGSTTECGMLDESENWGSVAEHDLTTTRDGRRVWVGNVGRSGLTSRDHVVTLKYLLPQHPRMDLIIVLMGVNDLTAAMRQGANYRSPKPLTDPEAEEIQIRNAFALSPGGFREELTADMVPEGTPWLRRTRLFRLARRARTAMRAREVVRGIGGASLEVWRANRASASRIIDTLPDLTAPLRDYRANQEAIIAEARRAGVEVIFLTLPALWKKDITPAEASKLWLGGTGNFQNERGHAYYSVPVLAEAMHRYNDVTLAVCREQRISCLDLAALVPRDTAMFYDDVHYTEAGAAMVGHALASHLRSAKPTVYGPRAGTARAYFSVLR